MAPAASHTAPAPAHGTRPKGVSQPQSGSEPFRAGRHADWGLLHGGQRRGAPGPRVPVTFSISRKHLPPCPESGGTGVPGRFWSGRSAHAPRHVAFLSAARGPPWGGGSLEQRRPHGPLPRSSGSTHISVSFKPREKQRHHLPEKIPSSVQAGARPQLHAGPAQTGARVATWG